MAITDQTKSFIALIQRSPKDDEGWASVGKMLTPITQKEVNAHPELYELELLDAGTSRIRLTETGHTVRKYL